MCDELQLAGMRSAPMDRRQFAGAGALTALAALTPAGTARAAGPNDNVVKFAAPGGTMDGFFFHPAGKNPGVILWPDIAGLRTTFLAKSHRLSDAGFAVLALNPYYRNAPAPQFEDFDDFRTRSGNDKVAPWRAALTADAIMDTAKAAIAWLDQQPSVDTAKGVGAQGYCMSGAYAVWTAAAVPERVKAVASFHGAGLVGDDEKSPVKLLGQTHASFLFAIARNDDKTAPGDKDALRAAAKAAGRPAMVDVYAADHGWTVADSPTYDGAAADKAWDKLLDLYDKL
ncbi:MAG: dienelactone hydrolase family protein [Croceibacterium sp.]